MKEKTDIILEIKKDKNGSVSASINDGTVIEVIIGIAEAIQLIIDGTGQNKQTILADIEKAIDILNEGEEK